MEIQSPLPVSFEAFLEEAYPSHGATCVDARASEVEERKARLAAFPYEVVLQVAYAQTDFAIRWCWQQFGPANGECLQYSSEYPACDQGAGHTHQGKWLTHWLAKTDYNFGFNEWCFAERADRDKFLEFVPQITWGEKYES